jgi:hypothetical protein
MTSRQHATPLVCRWGRQPLQSCECIKKKESSPATRHDGSWEERRHSSYSFLTSALDGVSGQRHASAAICAGERTPGTHCTGGWVGLRAGLDTEEKSFALPGIEPDRPVVQYVVRHYTDWGTPAPCCAYIVRVIPGSRYNIMTDCVKTILNLVI